MLMKIFSVRDSAVQAFTQPFFNSHTGGATRGFTSAINGADEHLSKHSSDFELYELGIFDDSNGSFSIYAEPHLVCRGKDVKLPAA